MGKSIGTEGESVMRVILDKARNVITTFPSHGFKSLLPILDVTGDGQFDGMDVFEMFNPGSIPVSQGELVI